jgi:hypothetical protein
MHHHPTPVLTTASRMLQLASQYQLCNNFRAGSTTMNKCERVLHLGVGCASVQELHGLLEVTMIYCLSSVQPPDCSAHLELVHERLEGFGDGEEGFQDSFAGRHLLHAPSSLCRNNLYCATIATENRDVDNISNLGITFCKITCIALNAPYCSGRREFVPILVGRVIDSSRLVRPVLERDTRQVRGRSGPYGGSFEVKARSCIVTACR